MTLSTPPGDSTGRVHDELNEQNAQNFAAVEAEIRRLREREAQGRKELGDALYEMRERAEAAEARADSENGRAEAALKLLERAEARVKEAERESEQIQRESMNRHKQYMRAEARAEAAEEGKRQALVAHAFEKQAKHAAERLVGELTEALRRIEREAMARRYFHIRRLALTALGQWLHEEK